MSSQSGKGAFIRRMLPAGLLTAANLTVFATFNVYRGNPAEFEVGYLEVLTPFLLLAVGIAGVLVSIGLFVPRGVWRDRYTAGIVALALLTWIQGNFLVWNYGVFDGRGIDWQSFDSLGWFDLGLWALALGGALAWARGVARVAASFTWPILILQAVLLFGQGGTGPGFWVRDYVPQDEIPSELLDYSSGRNIIHLVLDSFQSDVFSELVAEQHLEEVFNGFVQFTENATVAPHTPFAIPAVFSGQVFDGQESPAEYFQDAVAHGFHRRLHDSGYTVNLIPQLSMREGPFSHYYEIPTAYKGGPRERLWRNAALLLDVGLFRCVPHFLRKVIYDDGNWLVLPLIVAKLKVASFQEKAFFLDYIEGLRSGGSEPAYHFLHLMPPHPPYVTLADGSYAGKVLPNTRENFVNEARAVVLLLARLMQKLKALGLYDNALIILQGDHGSQIPPLVEGKPKPLCLPRMAALLAVKRPGASGPLKRSAAPTTVLDIAPTILQFAGVTTTGSGAPTVFDIPVDVPRTRPFMVYHGEGKAPYVSVYTLQGSIFDSAACGAETRVAVAMKAARYQLGSVIRFGMTGNSDPFLGEGWSSQFQLGGTCWTDGYKATLKLPMDPPAADILLTARLIPFLAAGQVPEQNVEVRANGSPVAAWVVTAPGSQQFQALIPRKLLQGSRLELSFQLPDATIPREIGAGGDARRLGIAMQTLALQPAGPETLQTPQTDAPPEVTVLGREFTFGLNGNAGGITGTGWSDATQEGICWNDQRQATLRFRLLELNKDVEIEARFLPYLAEGRVKRQRIRLRANGVPVAEWVADQVGIGTFQAQVPATRLVEPDLILTLEFPDAVSPHSLGLGADVRPLAIALHSVRLQ